METDNHTDTQSTEISLREKELALGCEVCVQARVISGPGAEVDELSRLASGIPRPAAGRHESECGIGGIHGQCPYAEDIGTTVELAQEMGLAAQEVGSFVTQKGSTV